MLYDTKNRRKFKLFCHLIFSTKYRRHLFSLKHICDDLKHIILESQKDFTVIEQETDKNHIHLMIDYDPKISVSQIVRHLKQITTNRLWKRHGNYLRRFLWKEKTLWADGYFVCSIGNSNPETIKKYIQNQG